MKRTVVKIVAEAANSVELGQNRASNEWVELLTFALENVGCRLMRYPSIPENMAVRVAYGY